MTENTPRRWHAWRHAQFWKMLGADVVLIAFTALIFPARTGQRLVVMIAAVVLASVVLNAILIPPAGGGPRDAKRSARKSR